MAISCRLFVWVREEKPQHRSCGDASRGFGIDSKKTALWQQSHWEHLSLSLPPSLAPSLCFLSSLWHMISFIAPSPSPSPRPLPRAQTLSDTAGSSSFPADVRSGSVSTESSPAVCISSTSACSASDSISVFVKEGGGAPWGKQGRDWLTNNHWLCTKPRSHVEKNNVK